jgi:hypothetical protein
MFNLEINLSLDAILASFKKMANTGGGEALNEAICMAFKGGGVKNPKISSYKRFSQPN